MLLVLAAYQLLHWFKPSEAYLVDYATGADGPYKLTVDTILHSVFPVATYSLFATTFVVVGVHTTLGHVASLWVGAAAGAVTVAIVLWGNSVTLLEVSEVTWALGFSALFVVSATMYLLVPPAWYQTASSVNTAAMLVGSVASSFVGFAMTDHAHTSSDGGHTSHAVRATFVVSLISAAAATVVVSVGAFGGCLRRRRPDATDAAVSVSPPQHTHHHRMAPTVHNKAAAPAGFVSRLWFVVRCTYSCPQVVLWTAISLLLRGPHTLVLTNWGELSKTIAPHAQRYNGILLGSAYFIAAVVVGVLGLRAVASHITRSPVVASVSTFVASCLCVAGSALMASASDIASLAAIFSVYNAAAEVALAIASAQMALHTVLRHEHPCFALQFPVVIGGKYLGGIAWQLCVQAVADAMQPGTRSVFVLYAVSLGLGMVAAGVGVIVAARATLRKANRRDRSSVASSESDAFTNVWSAPLLGLPKRPVV